MNHRIYFGNNFFFFLVLAQRQSKMIYYVNVLHFIVSYLSSRVEELTVDVSFFLGEVRKKRGWHDTTFLARCLGHLRRLDLFDQPLQAHVPEFALQCTTEHRSLVRTSTPANE